MFQEGYLWCGQTTFELQTEVDWAYCHAGLYMLCTKLNLEGVSQCYFVTGCDLRYLENVVRGILLQVGIQERLGCLQQSTEAEACKEWVVRFPLCHYC